MATKDDIKRWCVDNRHSNQTVMESFFAMLHDDDCVGLYSPMLSTAVLYCEWQAGDEVVDVTYEIVFVTPSELTEHVDWLKKAYGEDTCWTCDILADFDHLTLPLNEERWVDEAVVLLSTIGVATDWTSNPIKKD